MSGSGRAGWGPRGGRDCDIEKLGRPRKAFTLTPALLMLREGADLTTTAKAVGVSRTTLRRRFTEAGKWPLPGAVDNPPQLTVA